MLWVFHYLYVPAVAKVTTSYILAATVVMEIKCVTFLLFPFRRVIILLINMVILIALKNKKLKFKNYATLVTTCIFQLKRNNISCILQCYLYPSKRPGDVPKSCRKNYHYDIFNYYFPDTSN